MKRAIVAAAFLAMACGGEAPGTDPASGGMSRLFGVGDAVEPAPAAAGTVIDGCRCILDEGQPVIGVTGPADACASGQAITTACPGDVLALCPCAMDLPYTKPYDTCQHNLPAGSVVVLRAWTCT